MDVPFACCQHCEHEEGYVHERPCRDEDCPAGYPQAPDL